MNPIRSQVEKHALAGKRNLRRVHHLGVTEWRLERPPAFYRDRSGIAADRPDVGQP